MDSIKVRALLETISAGRLAKAAEALGYTPSGMSRMIAALEKELGLTLLLRDRSGVAPTAACRDLLPAFRGLLAADDAAEEAVRQVQGLSAGRLTVGAAYSRFYPLLSKAIADFSRQHPGVNVEFIEGTSSDLAHAVADHQADFCIISKRLGDFDWQLLLDDELIALVPRNHPLAAKPYMLAEDFLSEPFITIYPSQETDNSRFFAKQGIKPPEGYGTADVLAAVHMVEAGLGLTLVNGILVAQIQDVQVEKKPLLPAASVPIGVAVTKEATRSPAAEAFCRAFFARQRVIQA